MCMLFAVMHACRRWYVDGLCYLCPVDGFCDAEELFSLLLKESYYWPDTAQGDIAEIPCATLNEIYSSFEQGLEFIEGRSVNEVKGPFDEYLRLLENGPTAFRQCGFNGSWAEPDLTACLPCPLGQFFCPFEERCIDEIYICDGCTDCIIGADEQNCCKPLQDYLCFIHQALSSFVFLVLFFDSLFLSLFS